jgi:hypothetical protein
MARRGVKSSAELGGRERGLDLSGEAGYAMLARRQEDAEKGSNGALDAGAGGCGTGAVGL